MHRSTRKQYRFWKVDWLQVHSHRHLCQYSGLEKTRLLADGGQNSGTSKRGRGQPLASEGAKLSCRDVSGVEQMEKAPYRFSTKWLPSVILSANPENVFLLWRPDVES